MTKAEKKQVELVKRRLLGLPRLAIAEILASNVGRSRVHVGAGKEMTYKTVVTFESDTGDPVCVRGEIVESCPSQAARKAVFRALPKVGRTNYDSVVVVLDIVKKP